MGDKTLYDTVSYLEDFDFRGKTLLPSSKDDDLWVCMIYSSRCHYCIEAIPIFQQLANQRKDGVQFVSIQADGEKASEKALGDKLDQIIPGFQGFPTIVAFKGGKQIASFEDKRTPENLQAFIQQNQ